MERSTVVLPLPDGPMSAKQLAGPAIERHVERNGARLLRGAPRASPPQGPCVPALWRRASMCTTAMAASEKASNTADMTPASPMRNACTLS